MYHVGNAGVLTALFCVSSVIVDALKLAHSLVWENLRPTTAAATVLQLRELLHSPSVRSALERSSDALPAFAFTSRRARAYRPIVNPRGDHSENSGRPR